MSPARIRIGAVSYLNTRPLVHGIEQGLGTDRIRLSYAVPAVLADQMADGLLDIALMPVIEWVRMPELQLVPGLGIVTHGASRSVLLVTRRPVEQIESVALDPESRTSNALTRLLLAELWQRDVRFESGDAALEPSLAGCDAAVRIGDKALFEPLPPALQAYDLGLEWSQRTGLPFVFAAWFVRPGLLDRATYRLLHESRRRGSQALERLAADYRWKGRAYPELALRYLERNIRFGLGSAEIEALQLFFSLSARRNLIDRVPEIRFALGATDDGHETRTEQDEVRHA